MKTTIGKRGALLALSALGGLLALTGCDTPSRASITPTAIQNHTVGSHGYELPTPPGFQVRRLGDGFAGSDSLRQAGDRIAAALTTNASGASPPRFRERFLIENDRVHVFFAVKVFHASQELDLSSLSDRQQRRLLEEFLRNDLHGLPGRKSIVNEGRRMAASSASERIPNFEPAAACDVYLLPGKRNEAYVFVGISKIQDRDEMVQVTRSLLRELRL